MERGFFDGIEGNVCGSGADGFVADIYAIEFNAGSAAEAAANPAKRPKPRPAASMEARQTLPERAVAELRGSDINFISFTPSLVRHMWWR